MSYDFQRFEQVKMPNISKKTIWIAVAVVFALVVVYGTVYQVQPEEAGVVLRFGKYQRTSDPGLNFKLPLGIEQLIKVPVQRQLKMEFGFRTSQPGISTRYAAPVDAQKEASMLTGDLNVVDAEWIVQYQIRDPYKYLFKVRNVNDTFRYMNETVVRKVIGDNSVDEVLTIGRARIAAEAKDLLQELCNLYEIGIDVKQMIFQDVNPPEQVKPSFNEVNQSLQEKERKINEAWSDYNQTIPRVSGEAEEILRRAEGYALARVNRARGEAERFIAMHQEYAKSPDVTRKRLYLETISEIMPKIGRKVIVDEKQKNVLPLLNLAEELKKEVEK
jgi:membrane protease subunit HflK